jgi:acylphosphatase
VTGPGDAEYGADLDFGTDVEFGADLDFATDLDIGADLAFAAEATDTASDAANAPVTEPEARLTAWIRGRVQGVGFRWWVRRNALELGLLGVAENLIDGRVKVVAEGDRDNLVELLGRLEGPGTPGQVAQVTFRWDQFRGGFTGFVER